MDIGPGEMTQGLRALAEKGTWAGDGMTLQVYRRAELIVI